jgi:hypothetical protein
MSRIKHIAMWAETVLAASSGVLAVVTIFWRDWIEGLTGWDPDHHNGSFEVLLILALALVSASAGLLARRTWQRRAARAAVSAL